MTLLKCTIPLRPLCSRYLKNLPKQPTSSLACLEKEYSSSCSNSCTSFHSNYKMISRILTCMTRPLSTPYLYFWACLNWMKLSSLNLQQLMVSLLFTSWSSATCLDSSSSSKARPALIQMLLASPRTWLRNASLCFATSHSELRKEKNLSKKSSIFSILTFSTLCKKYLLAHL